MLITIESLFILIIFILPGFILASVYNRNISRSNPTDSKLVIESIGFSTFNHLISYFYTAKIYAYYHTGTLFDKYIHYFALWILLVVFLLPIFFGWFFSKIVEAEQLQNFFERIGLSIASRTNQAWNYFFQQESGVWVIIYLKSGVKVGGIFGQKSFASLSPNPKDIYLEKAYKIKGENTFGNPLGDNVGIWINGDNIERIEFFKKKG